ncbi:UDP-4-amino-4,6-dideoxy-N-acetyl-beta-L-altrosamine N-acetyltransferase, partial [Alcaligenaceae bacterium 429]
MLNRFGVLRPACEADLEMMLIWRNHPEVRKNMYTRHEISWDEHHSWWKKTSERKDQKYFIYEDQGKPSGVVSFVDIDLHNENCFWAFYASQDAYKGVGSRMEFLALSYVFETLKVKKLSCEVLDFNKSVIRLHEKFGFKIEGVFRKHHKFDGGFVDIYRLSILNEEWLEIKD